MLMKRPQLVQDSGSGQIPAHVEPTRDRVYWPSEDDSSAETREPAF